MNPKRGAELLEWIASIETDARDAAVHEHLGIAHLVPDSAPPGNHLVGYHASSAAAIVHTLIEVPVTAEDVVVDLGAGLGKVVFLAHLLTGAVSRGIELQSSLVTRARAAARALSLDVRFTEGDAREAPFDDGTVFFLYAPFTGPVLARVTERLDALAERRPIVVCALGIELAPARLLPRPTDSFWLSIYDSPLVRRRHPSPLLALASNLRV